MTKTMDINELVSKLKEYDGEMTVKVWSNGANKAYPISHVFIGSINKEDLVYINIGDRINEKAPVYINIGDRNLVDLSKIWHDASEEPLLEEKEIIFINKKGVAYISERFGGTLPFMFGNCSWERYMDLLRIDKWAYVADLLPKGGAK